jgi:hypothetical protein
MNWYDWMESQGVSWADLISDLNNAPLVKELIQRASQDFLSGQEDTAGLAELIGILAGDI